jgi:cytochrome b involved in lipid metabolism
LHVLEELDGVYSLTGYANAEVKFIWQKLCLDSEAPWIVKHVVDFVTTQGRMKFVRPLYKALRYSKVGAYAAITTFAKYANVYHPICKKMVSKDFAVADERSPLPKGWMVIEGKVYDVEAYLNFHPGGDAVLVDHFGRDATDSFLDVGHSGGARRLLKSYYVMNVDGTKDPKEEPKKTVAPKPAAVSESAAVSSSSSSSTAASTTTAAPASNPTASAAPTATPAPSNVDIPAPKPIESSTNWLPIIGGATLVAIAVFAVLRSRK